LSNPNNGVFVNAFRAERHEYACLRLADFIDCVIGDDTAATKVIKYVFDFNSRWGQRLALWNVGQSSPLAPQSA